jgi:uncharacterized membrane protein YjdF
MVYEAVAAQSAQGWRVETLTPTAAVLVGGVAASRRFHLVNAALTLMTCGFWLPVWAVATLVRRRRARERRLITVDDAGRLSIVALPRG